MIDTTKPMSHNLLYSRTSFDDNYIKELCLAYNREYDHIIQVIEKHVRLGDITKTNGKYVPNVRRSALGVKVLDTNKGIRRKNYGLTKKRP